MFNLYREIHMKKSLIALAVLAASGASFAQVTVTGNLTSGYQSITTGEVKTSPGGAVLRANGEEGGMGVETANVVFTAKEDLGGGYAATASMQLNTGAASGNRGAQSDNTTLTLATPVGGLVIGTARAADYLSGGIAGVGAYYAGWDGSANKIFTDRTYRDFASFVVPVGAFTFSLTQADAASDTTFGSGTTGGSSVGTGTFAATSGGSNAPVSTLSATYAAGPAVVNAQYATYKNSGLPNAGTSPNAKDTTRLSGSYDLGMVKLGAGVVITNHTANTGANTPKTTDYLVAAKIPMGASSFGVSWAQRTMADYVNTFSGTGSGYSLEYGYAMSKRTSVIANYARWTTPAAMNLGFANGNDVAASSQYQLLLSHSF